MKEIVLPKTEQKTVVLDKNTKLNNNLYYGVSFGKHDFRGFITREYYDSGNYFIIYPESMTNGNGWRGISSSSLESMVEKILSSEEKHKVYQFDNFIDLMKWVDRGEK